MLQKPKNWIAETLWKPKKTHSLEQLRYLHYILQRNSTVTEANKGLVVETLRSIAEILIWGDQNDSTVFDFFLEKNMLLFFLKFMTQNCGSYVTVQLLQTLNILFENIRHETSLYFLLSNNHVNSIIVHKFDFSNEEVLAYYISFLKTLSLKLNLQTINFFFNEVKSDFPLYTEGIKFFHHPESMVRIAVRTLSLNVYKVGHQKMLEFICDKTATPYFSNLIWLIGKDAIELDDCVQQETDHFKYDALKASVADHLDHVHYLNDIFHLQINVLNRILTDHMLNRLLIPLYVYSLPTKDDTKGNDPERVTVSKLVALFLLAQHLLITKHSPLVNALVDVVFNEEEIESNAYLLDSDDTGDNSSLLSNISSSSRAFIPPPAPLESQLEACGITKDTYNLNLKLKLLASDTTSKRNSTFYVAEDGNVRFRETESGSEASKDNDDVDDDDEFERTSDDDDHLLELAKQADKMALIETDAQKNKESSEDVQNTASKGKQSASTSKRKKALHETLTLTSKISIFIASILKSLKLSNGDSEAFFALCFLYAVLTNKGLDRDFMKSLGLALPEECEDYNEEIFEKLLMFLEKAIKDESATRLVTFEMGIKVIRLIMIQDKTRRITDHHMAVLESIREASVLQLRSFYKGDDIFVDTFEGEYHHMKAKPINVEYVAMDASLLLPPTVTPLTGIDFIKRLPCGDDERTQRAAHIFIMMRELALDLQGEEEHYLPLSKVQNPVKVNEVLDLNNSDLIACTIVQQSKQSIRRFLVIDTSQFILVEPDTSKLGWGVVMFVSHLQDVEANPDKDDSRSLNIVIQQPFTRRSKSGYNPLPIMAAKFVFDDYIRCMSARQRLQKRRDALRHRKMSTMAMLLDLPPLASPTQSYYSFTNVDTGLVWSPSSRGYSSTRLPNTFSNNVSNTSTDSPFTLLSPQTPQSANKSQPTKSKLLSPKMEQILKKTQLKTDVGSAENATLTPTSALPRASPRLKGEKLFRGPVEITGHDTGRARSSTTEVGEEIDEQNISSSLILAIQKETVQEVDDDSTSLKLDKEKNDTISKEQILENEKKWASIPLVNRYQEKRSENTISSRCASAPATPRGRRRNEPEALRRSQSLPAMSLAACSEERRIRATRARVKAKSVKSRGNKGKRKKK